MITEHSTLADICFEVASALQAHGMSAVVVGGSAAVLYAPGAYFSNDADFILEIDRPLDAIAAALGETGFRRVGRSRLFEHPHSDFTVDFPKGPLAVGGDFIAETATIERGDQRIRIITRIDCVRDRLAHFYYWDDYTALETAVSVAAQNIAEIDLEQLRAWTKRESPDLLQKFSEFERRLNAAQGSREG